MIDVTTDMLSQLPCDIALDSTALYTQEGNVIYYAHIRRDAALRRLIYGDGGCALRRAEA